jgi:hypothetical protein
MDDLAAECDTLKRLLALHELDRARSWLAGALDMVDAARRVRDETKRTLRDALKHLGADVPLEADAAHALDDEEDGDATVSHDGSARDSDDDDEAAILPPQDMQLPDDDDAPFWVVPQVATEDANADIAMEAAETLSQLSKNKPAHTKRRKALSATETCGELGALIMMNFAIRSGRHEDSIPFSVITEAIDAAQKAAAEAEEAEEAARIAQALDIEEQATAASVAASAAGGTATDVTSLSDLIGLTPVKAESPAADVKDKRGGGSDKKPGAPSTKRGLAAAAAGTRNLFSFAGFQKQDPTTSHRPSAGHDDLVFHPFVDGDRKAAPRLRLWATDLPAVAPVPKNLSEVLNRNEVDVRGMGTPRNFDAEAVFVIWNHENYVTSEARPPFLGTWNSNLDALRLGRPAGMSEPLTSPFAVTRVAGIEYDDDSGDDWDSEGEGSEVAGDEARSEESGLDSDEQSFFADDDDVYSNAEEREEAQMEKSEMDELDARRKRKNVELEPRYDGVFDGVPLKHHPMSQADRMGYVSGAAAAFLEGREYLRIARTILEQAGIAVPAELLSEAELAVAAARKAKDEAAAARAAAGVVVRKAKRIDRPPVSDAHPPLDGSNDASSAVPVPQRQDPASEIATTHRYNTRFSARASQHPAGEGGSPLTPQSGNTPIITVVKKPRARRSAPQPSIAVAMSNLVPAGSEASPVPQQPPSTSPPREPLSALKRSRSPARDAELDRSTSERSQPRAEPEPPVVAAA